MRAIVEGFRVRIVLSLLMVIVEAAGGVVLPFMIGVAIDDYLVGSYRGLIALASVGLATMLLATTRRILDVRLYTAIYERATATALQQTTGLSAKTARLNMLREVVDFLEHSIPGLVASISTFIGTLAFLAVLSLPVFFGAITMAAVIVVVYALTTRRTLTFNRGYNDEYEQQVDVLDRNDVGLTKQHIRLLNGWLIKLSDLDATNYAISLTLTIALQCFAIIVSADNGMDAGNMLSIVLYVFEFAATAAFLPASWQEYLRLRDILRRLRRTE